jgi:hypothetical protein
MTKGESFCRRHVHLQLRARLSGPDRDGGGRVRAGGSRFGEDVREPNRTDYYRIRSTGTRLKAIPLAVRDPTRAHPAGSA